MTIEEMEKLVAPFVKNRLALDEDWWMDFLIGVALGGIVEGEYEIEEEIK